jgi:transposase
MTRFVVGDDRSQSTLFPERLEDYLSEDNPVRAIDVFVDELEMRRLTRSRPLSKTPSAALRAMR